VAAGQPIRGSLGFDAAHWTDTTRITLELDGPDTATIATHDYSRTTPQGEPLTATAASTGFHTFRIRSSETPAENLKPSYKLSVTYKAPEMIEPAP
jgi:hypothetical protein